MPSAATTLPRALYRASEVRQLDRLTADHFGIGSFALMQRAGQVCFQALTRHWPDCQHLLVFAGAGNNGGDAWIVAGLAREQGLRVQLITAVAPELLRGDASTARDWALVRQVTVKALDDFLDEGLTDSRQTVLVDGLIGTGLDRQVTGDFRRAIACINASQRPVLAIDIPSGLHADTGRVMGAAVKANLTVSVIGMKQGLLTGMAGTFTGQLLFSDLDIPTAVYSHAAAPQPAVRRIDILDATAQIQPRPAAVHKGDQGHVAVVGGDLGYGGAALLAAESALRAGAGLVTVLTRSRHRPALLARRPELMVVGTEDENLDVPALLTRSSVIVVGPGLGTTTWARRLHRQCLSAQLHNETPLVIDADGLNLLAERSSADVVRGSKLKRQNWVLTPHPGEAARLLDWQSSQVADDRFAAIRALQETWGGDCLLKGHGSLIVNRGTDGKVLLCNEGNSGLATAGTGDVLAGLIAGLIAQGLETGNALLAAVCIHGEAADLAAQDGERGLVATDLFPFIRQLVNAGC